MTPAKALKARATLMMRMPADAATWVARCQAVMERLKAKEAAVKAGVSAQEGTRVRDIAQLLEWVEAAPGATGLNRSRCDEQELGDRQGRRGHNIRP
jgi:hypothetical protein